MYIWTIIFSWGFNTILKILQCSEHSDEKSIQKNTIGTAPRILILLREKIYM